jgi:hypothetical protein
VQGSYAILQLPEEEDNMQHLTGQIADPGSYAILQLPKEDNNKQPEPYKTSDMEKFVHL